MPSCTWTARGTGRSEWLLRRAVRSFPTIAEAAPLPGYALESWFAAVMPTGTPKPIVDRLSQSLQNALRSKEMQDRVAALGQDFTPDRATPEALAALLKSEIAKWTPLLKDVPAANH